MRWVAGIRNSVHTKLLCAFLLIALLIVAVTAISLQILATMGRHSRSLDGWRIRVLVAKLEATSPGHVGPRSTADLHAL